MTETEVKALLERQAAWQRGRAALPWAEKLRMSVAMREALVAMRGGDKGSPERHDLKEPRSLSQGA
jgi:hypothetical protein